MDAVVTLAVPPVRKRPPLGPIAVGDTVLIVRQGCRPYETTVCHVGRVWVTLGNPERPGTQRRMRLDTQDYGSGVGVPTRFVTPEQHAFDRALQEASDFLKNQGIAVHFGSPWHEPGRCIQLAEILRQAVES